MHDKKTLFTRRKALQGAGALIGGGIAVANLTAFASRAAAAGDAPAFFDAKQFALLERIVDVMIPETDTPGALGVGVHYFIDLMLAEWASPERQSGYVDGLDRLDAALHGPGGERFVERDAASQLDTLRALDATALSDDGGDPFYSELKHMILFAYYSSETGATEELRHQALPGVYHPCLPVDDDTRAWFHLTFSHAL